MDTEIRSNGSLQIRLKPTNGLELVVIEKFLEASRTGQTITIMEVVDTLVIELKDKP